jgi:heptosyltransferase-3
MKVPSNILVIVMQRIGDVLFTTPFIRSLHCAWPDSHIDVLVFDNTKDVITSNRDIRRVITVKDGQGLFRDIQFLVSILRRYDLAISTQSGDRPTFYAFIAGKYRIGTLENETKQYWKRLLLNKWIEFDNINTHTVIMNLTLAGMLGININCETVVSWSSADEENVHKMLPFAVDSEPFAVLHLYPKFHYKMWHENGWVTLAKWLLKNGYRVILTGSNSPAEVSYIDRVFQMLPGGALNVAGRLSLSELGFLISHSRIYVGLDTAPTHMAAMLGVPTVALYGPTNPIKWGPWPKSHACNSNPYVKHGSQNVENVMLVQGIGDCVPCHEEGCERRIDSLSKCLQNLEPATVIEAVRRALEHAPTKPVF